MDAKGFMVPAAGPAAMVALGIGIVTLRLFEPAAGGAVLDERASERAGAR
jgi:hypothetical protein